ncbi:MAG: FAD-binding protein, partial [Planctomycetota bacterium]|nr:FAD-binding protein [Planctomycetota bacterium]
VYLDFRDAIRRDGEDTIRARYGNLFQMYERITGENPYGVPMRIFPAVHYTMGGLWVDYNLETTVPGLFALGECNFSDHGANRLGASALMQGLADGYFVAPATLASHIAGRKLEPITTDHDAFKAAEADSRGRFEKLLSIGGSRTVDSFHRELGLLCWNHCGMSRTAEGLQSALDRVRELRGEFWNDVRVLGDAASLNQNLEHAGRVADFMEFAELMIADALHRDESCGGHFREEHQTDEGEALRNDERFAYAAAWEHQGADQEANLHKEALEFENVKLTTRSYK